MSEKRRDKRGRILHNGEIQMPDGRYRFKYTDGFGAVRYVYSWRLDKNDTMPGGKKSELSLREKERLIAAERRRTPDSNDIRSGRMFQADYQSEAKTQNRTYH